MSLSYSVVKVHQDAQDASVPMSTIPLFDCQKPSEESLQKTNGYSH